MAESRDIVAFVHVSDVHIGTGPMPSRKEFYRGLRGGYNPHDHRLLEPLDVAIRDARRVAEVPSGYRPKIVLSGDLTQYGTDNDYAIAYALVHERWKWKKTSFRGEIGLGWARDDVLSVPGNHDHWRAEKRPTGYSPDVAPTWFEPTPWRHEWVGSGGNLRVGMYGIDSNSGFSTAKPGKCNLRAEGRISDAEFIGLENLLNSREAADDDVRVLVCHHAFSRDGAAKPLTEDSLRDLLRIAEKWKFGVALTGHTHDFRDIHWPKPKKDDPPDRYRLRELRCATTLQGTRRRGAGRQGFYMHRVERKIDGDFRWTAWKYQSAKYSFDVDLANPIEIDIPAI